MPPLIIYSIGVIAVILYVLLPWWLSVPAMVAMVLFALFRLRHLGRARSRFEGAKPDVTAPLLASAMEAATAAEPAAEATVPHKDHSHDVSASAAHAAIHHQPSTFLGDGGGHQGGHEAGGGGGHGH